MVIVHNFMLVFSEDCRPMLEVPAAAAPQEQPFQTANKLFVTKKVVGKAIASNVGNLHILEAGLRLGIDSQSPIKLKEGWLRGSGRGLPQQKGRALRR